MDRKTVVFYMKRGKRALYGLRSIALIVCCAFCFFSTAVRGAGWKPEVAWFSDYDVSIGHNDNVGRAEDNQKIVADTFLSINYSLISNIELGDYKAVTFKFFAERAQLDQLRDLSRSTFGLGFIYRWQNTLGYLEPFYEFSSSVEVRKFGADQRDSTRISTQLFATRRLSDTFTLVAGLEHLADRADSDVFDLNHDRFFVNLDYSTQSGNILYGSYSFRRGEIWSTARSVLCDGGAGDISSLVAEAQAVEPDDAFNDAFCGTWRVYQLEADTQVLTFGINVPVGNSSALDFSLTQVESNAAGSNNYDSTVFQASYLVRFR